MKTKMTIALLSLICLWGSACNTNSPPGASDAKTASDQKSDQKLADSKSAAAGDQKTSQTTAAQPAPKITVPAGISLPVRLSQSLSTEKNNSGDIFEAELDRDVRVGEMVAIPARSIVKGRIYHLERSGKVSGRAEMGLTLTSVVVGGKTYPIQTSKSFHRAPATKKSDAKWIGGGAAGGALIGAIAGGKKGAAIGAVVGGGAGSGKVLATRGKPVAFAAESRLTFKLNEPLSTN